MSELPAGWGVAPLSALSADADQCVPADDEAFTYIDIGSIDREAKSISSPQVLSGREAPSRARKKVMAGDTVVSMTRPNLNAVALVPPELDGQIASTGFDVLRPLNGIDPRWLGYLVRSEAFVTAMSDLVQGALYPAVRAKDVRGYVVPVAPSAEQTRIADQLDTLLARIKACNDHLDAIPGLLKRFRQAVMNAALAGMLDDLDGEATRQIVKVSDIATVGTGSTPLRSNGSFYSDTGTPWVTSAATGDAYVSNADQFVTPAAIAAHRLKVYPKGTLLVAMYGEGKTRGQVSELAIEATINQACAAICVDESRALTSFVKIALAANYLAMRELAEGGNQPNLNLSKIKDFEIPLPSLEVQVEILNRTNDLLAVADRIEAQYTAARSQTKRLASQILDKSFRGELVPQDAKDEPASQLLQRIAAEQAEVPKTAPSGKKRGRKAAEMPAAQPAGQTGVPAWMDLPADAWSDHGAVHDEHVVTAMLTAVLKAWGQPMPQEQARLAALLCLQPRLFTAALPADHAKQWRRLVGQAAEPLPAQVASLQPALNTPWRRALAGMRGRGDLLESGQGTLAAWSLGPEASHVDTSGWPDGRAAFTLAYLQTQGVDVVLPTLSMEAQEFVHARAA